MVGQTQRVIFCLLGGDWPVEQLAYFDDLEAVGAGRRGRRAAVFAIALPGVFGFPAQRSKTRGGLEVDWIAPHCDCAAYTVGPPEARAAWVANSCKEKVERGVVRVDEMTLCLGRLGFAAMALVWEGPLLGPIHAGIAGATETGKKIASFP